MPITHIASRIALGLLALLPAARAAADGPILAPQPLLERETFWDNRDWDWYRASIPFFECPEPELQTTYYYRWELLTKHLVYGSPNSGYAFTEFIDRPFWSGAYGAISCPSGHQLYEARWLRDPRIAHDYVRYWFRTPGAQPRNYTCWLADAAWAVHRIHPAHALLEDLLPDLKRNYEGWERTHFDPEVGLFWQTGHDDGMEFNINSRQTGDILRGAPGYRPTINAYLFADALAIARAADLAGDAAAAREYRAKAAALKANLQSKLWDGGRQFFFPMSRRDEGEGGEVKARTLTYQTGKHAGSRYGRELIGYVPWQFGLPDAGKGYEAAWRKLFDKDGFAAPFGPTTVERNDPMFLVTDHCCWWSGQSWPYATSQALKALANLLQQYEGQAVATRDDYMGLLRTFSRTHRKDGRPYLAEGADPDTGSFRGYDNPNHSEHYFHSSFNDLVITGLAGLCPRDDEAIEVRPLAPADWPYFALDAVPYQGRLVSIIWDRDGTRYHRGRGLRIFVNGAEVAASERLAPLSGKLPALKPAGEPAAVAVNYAANNDGTYYPRVTASYVNPRTPLAKVADGSYWYHREPANRWTCEGSANPSDSVVVDFGTPRTLHTVKLDFLDDGTGVTPPSGYELESWDGSGWKAIPGQERAPARPAGHRANVVTFPPVPVTRLRAVFIHADGGRTGLTEVEAWGDAVRPVPAPPPPSGNLAYNPRNEGFPRATASHSDRFGGVAASAIDGRINFLPNPFNRWTAYESPRDSDWLEVDFGAEKEFDRVELAIYDDHGGVQPPARYDVEFWDGGAWRPVAEPGKVPERPAGGAFNEVRFRRARASKLRVVFAHAGPARSGVTEILVWND